MLTLVLQLAGRMVALLPQWLGRFVAIGMGFLISRTLPRRRRLLWSNLDHAFPQKSPAWKRRIIRDSSRRLAETALLSLAAPYLSEARIRRTVQLAPEARRVLDQLAAEGRPAIFCTAHLAYWETLTWLLLLAPDLRRPFGVIFRPLDNPTLDRFVQRTRERFGMRLLSRKSGLQDAIRILRDQGQVGLLFDQNAGLQGALTTLFGRVCSTTDLTGMLAERMDATVIGIYPRRRDFFRVEIQIERIPLEGRPAMAPLALNQWLEERLTADDDLCASWLWTHDRWRNQDIPARRLRLEAKRSLLAEDRARRGWSELPRKTRVFVRLPNWLGDVVMLIPLLRAVRASRPDAELTLIGKGAFRSLVEAAGVADRFEPLPPRGLGYWRHFNRLRRRYPDVYLLFTNSLRGDLEARLTHCRQRFGIVRKGKHRPLLSHAFRPAPDFDESRHHLLVLWEDFLRHFGLAVPPQRQPLARTASSSPPASRPALIGLIAGSENTPEKRWPVAHWRSLIAALPDQRFVLLGTAGDRVITEAIADGFDPDRVENLAGKTDLQAFGLALQRCQLLVSNDTGGMHLANALGVPTVALFGPTNPVRTAPVFASDVHILQPPGCPSTGGGSLNDLSPESVVQAVQGQLMSLNEKRLPSAPRERTGE